MVKNYMNFEEVTLPEVILDFKRKYPTFSYETLDGMKMRKILAGILVMVKISGKRKYQLWTQKDIDDGKLDAMNRKIRNFNRSVRVAFR